MAQSACAVAGRIERAHQLERDPAIEAIQLGKAPPPPARRWSIARVASLNGERLQRLGIERGEPLSLPVRPALEFFRFREMKAVQERPAIGADGILEPPLGERSLEFPDITTDMLRTDPYIIASGRQ